MGRMDLRGSATAEMEIPAFGGLNTAKTFSEIAIHESPRMLNLLPKKIGGLANRPGTVPLTSTAIGTIKTLCNLRKGGTNTIYAAAGNALFKYASGAFTGLTMTNPLVRPEIDTAQFKNEAAVEVMIIADGGSLKYTDGVQVANITPLPDDGSALPANVLTDLNTNHKPIGCVVHHTRVVVWDGTDRINHSKVGFHDYFPATDYQRWVKENDYVMTCLSYAGALLVLMRRHVGVLFGHDVGNWLQDFLDTNEGCMNAKTVQNVTFPDGRQEVFYLSDGGVQSVYMISTKDADNSSRYSTKSVTRNQIDWRSLGVEVWEWELATAYFHDGMYWLVYPKDGNWKGLVFNTIDGQWYPIDAIQANGWYHDENYFYFAGNDGFLKVFDETLNADYTNIAKTNKTIYTKEWYSKLLTPKVTGYDHFWDVLMIEARQFKAKSTIDVEVNTYSGQFVGTGALKTEIFVVGVSNIGQAQITNAFLTEPLNNVNRITPFLKGKYAQVKISSARDEPMEILYLKWEVRNMTKY